jgi:membrane-associated protease RseP (regulator of RpoE activity)
MKPLLSARVLLLAGAIAFVVLLFWVRTHPQKPEDPLADAVDSLSKGLGLEVESSPLPNGGVLVKGVRPESPAQRLGLRAGDRIVAVGDRSVWHAINLAEFISQALSQGYPVPVLVETKGNYHPIIMGRGLHAGPGQSGRAVGPGR